MSLQRSILVINCGSSSLKFSLYDQACANELASGLADRLGTGQSLLKWREGSGQTHAIALTVGDHLDALKAVVDALTLSGYISQGLLGIGHRVVHGGEHFSDSALVNEQNIELINQCAQLAPLHNPANVLGITTLQHMFAGVPQVAVFDTAFHQSIPIHAYLYPLPYKFYEDHGVRRYGFHGTSHAFVAKEAVSRLNLASDDHAIICAHLGNGCSATAIKNSKSIDTTMGMTPLEGVCMGTRSGDIDPSIHQYLCHKLGLSIDEVTDILNKQSGLLGISQTSNDMRNLSEAAEAGDIQAQLAIDVFCYRLAKHISALCVPLGRLDALVFTGGIGENAVNIRAQVCEQLTFLGVKLSMSTNEVNGRESNGIISEDHSTPVIVIQTQEEWYIANETRALVTQHCL